MRAYADLIVQADGLIDQVEEVVEAVRAAGANAQAKIDLGERSNRYRHGRI